MCVCVGCVGVCVCVCVIRTITPLLKRNISIQINQIAWCSSRCVNYVYKSDMRNTLYTHRFETLNMQLHYVIGDVANWID